jgi:hypothetical protein
MHARRVNTKLREVAELLWQRKDYPQALFSEHYADAVKITERFLKQMAHEADPDFLETHFRVIHFSLPNHVRSAIQSRI